MARKRQRSVCSGQATTSINTTMLLCAKRQRTAPQEPPNVASLPECGWHSLPPELVFYILSFVPSTFSNVMSVSLVCKAWQGVARSCFHSVSHQLPSTADPDAAEPSLASRLIVPPAQLPLSWSRQRSVPSRHFSGFCFHRLEHIELVLSSVSLASFDRASFRTHLRSLVLYQCIVWGFDELPPLPQLEKLDLSYSVWGDADQPKPRVAWAKMLPALRMLVARGCHELDDAFLEGVEELRHLQDADLRDTSLSAPKSFLRLGASNGRAVRSLRFSEVSLVMHANASGALQCMLAAIGHTLTMLELSACDMTLPHVRSIAILCGQRLTSLKLARNRFLADEVLPLITRTMPRLRELDLSNTSVGAHAEELEIADQMQTLNLDSSRLTIDAYTAVCAAMPHATISIQHTWAGVHLAEIERQFLLQLASHVE